MFRKARWLAAFLIAAAANSVSQAGPTTAVGETITIQGQLKSDLFSLEGTFDFYFEFSLYDGPGPAAAQKAWVAIDPVEVTNGIFTAAVDFSANDPDFRFTDEQWYLQICTRPSSESGACDTLSPRIGCTKVPYASISAYVELGKEQEGNKSTALWKTKNSGTGGAAKFEVANGSSLADALVVVSNAGGAGIRTDVSGSGTGIHSSTSGGGNAGVFSILGASNSSDALLISTVGGGAAVRATAASGFGLIAESTSGIGLRATSTSGTALDVLGSSAFSGTADFNHATPFRVASPALIPNLNAALLGSQSGSYYTNASNLATGIVPDLRLAPVIARTNVSQIFSAAQTFTGATVAANQPTPALSVTNGGAGRAANFSANSTAAALIVSNSGGGRAGEFTGNVHTSAAYTQAYSVGTANRATPIAYGSFSAANGLGAHTPNVASVTWDAGLTRYVIDLGETYNIVDYITTVTPVVTGGGAARVATSSANLGKLVVRIFDLQGDPVQQDFHFVVFKP